MLTSINRQPRLLLFLPVCHFGTAPVFNPLPPGLIGKALVTPPNPCWMEPLFVTRVPRPPPSSILRNTPTPARLLFCHEESPRKKNYPLVLLKFPIFLACKTSASLPLIEQKPGSTKGYISGAITKTNKQKPTDLGWCASKKCYSRWCLFSPPPPTPTWLVTSSLRVLKHIFILFYPLSLKVEYDKLANEKTEMQRHYVMVRDFNQILHPTAHGIRWWWSSEMGQGVVVMRDP